jgi:hypothetical protein
MLLLTAAPGFSTQKRDAAVAELVGLLHEEGGTRFWVDTPNMTPSNRAPRTLNAELQDALPEAA